MVWLIHRRGVSFGHLFAARTSSIATDLAVGVALGIVWTAVYGLARWVPFADMFVFDPAKLGSVPNSLSAGFCEEFLFRGFVFLVIARAGGGIRPQMLYSSIAFGVAHVFWGPWGMLVTAILGLSLAAVRAWRGSVWSAVVAHTVLNLCIEPALMQAYR